MSKINVQMRPLAVLFDTNVWKGNLFLRAETGALVREYLSASSAVIIMPEVLRIEIEHYLRSDVTAWRNSLRDSYGKLLHLFGKMKELVIPSDEEIDAYVAAFLLKTSLPLKEVPFDIQGARASFQKIVWKRAPSSSTQQFKDGVIWDACARMAHEYRVVVVTSDRQFFEEQTYSKGLAASLRKELNEGEEVEIFSNFADFLASVKSPVQLHADSLPDQVRARFAEYIEPFINENGLNVVSAVSTLRAFATERPGSLYVDFSIVYDCEGGSVTDASIKVSGEAWYSTADKQFSSLAPGNIQTNWTSSDGLPHQGVNSFMSGFVQLGHADVFSRIREPLDLDKTATVTAA